MCVPVGMDIEKSGQQQISQLLCTLPKDIQGCILRTVLCHNVPMGGTEVTMYFIHPELSGCITALSVCNTP